MVSHSLVLGYHGCDVRVARKVISLKESLHPSQNPWDWLGHGFYFWEDSPARALRWAEAESRRRGSKIKRPAVLGAVIDLGNCLNLADADAFNQVRVTHDEYERLCNAAGIEKAGNRGPDLRARYLDCAVIPLSPFLRRKIPASLISPLRRRPNRQCACESAVFFLIIVRERVQQTQPRRQRRPLRARGDHLLQSARGA